MNFFVSNSLAATSGTSSQGNSYSLAIMLVIFSLLFYFIILRPQQIRTKERKKLMDSISKGDEILTNGGLIGRVIKVIETGYLIISLNETTEVMIKSDFVNTILPKGTIKAL
ncbi:preprotein translocase subunit YajC [Pantoea sp. Mhis]|uniref:preprotein translocase subunit YajC n=1 Tax=Pantoea sp. Mhis TaxID=2576759 RepID=UPI001356C4AC|nr:preprotein translocase subunit YajC [Pantoea sp. Mhis]MXP56230.1 preprotein translocase subunit YajC [Pantoea sp. Mhis]